MLDLTAPPPRPLVAASILSADFGRIADECRDALDAGADLLHVDVMDGHFVPNLTMGADMVKALRRHFRDVYLDVHLMVERPEQFAEMFAQAGANNFTFHLEVSRLTSGDGAVRGGGGVVDAHALIERLHALGMHAGMAVNPPTPAEGLAEFLGELDLVLVMSVNPGRSGQAFLPETLSKTRWVKERIGPGVRLEMDGGINPATASACVAAGADVLVTASVLFGAADRAGVIRELHAARGR